MPIGRDSPPGDGVSAGGNCRRDREGNSQRIAGVGLCRTDREILPRLILERYTAERNFGTLGEPQVDDLQRSDSRSCRRLAALETCVCPGNRWEKEQGHETRKAHCSFGKTVHFQISWLLLGKAEREK